MLSQLSGSRTHLVVGLYLVTIVYQIVTGEIAVDVNVVQEALTAMGVSAIREGMKKLQPPAA